ncbi:hypothetical protein HYS31_05365 [Candidatus Woesearchaeota archaeon]|nr:hypothetical protein [Candidatus Woesearchaeota archaeon]
MSELVFHDKKILDNEHLMEIRIWQVKKDKYNPEGFHYSLVLIKNTKRILGYDNHERKGHHKHFHDKELKYNFESVDKLLNDFYEDMQGMMLK